MSSLAARISLVLAVSLPAAIPSSASAISVREIPAPDVVALAGSGGTLWYATPTQLNRLDASGKLVAAYALPRGVTVATGHPGQPFPAARNGGMWFMATKQVHHHKVWLIGSISPAGRIKLRKLRRGHGGNLLVRDSHGNSWFADHVNRHHKRFSAIGELTRKGRLRDFRIPLRSTNLMSIAIGSDRKVWFTSCRASGAGTYVGVLARRHVRRFGITGPLCPSDIAPGPDGALWYTLRLYAQGQIRDQIGRITTSGHAGTYDLGNTQSQPEGIVAGPDGALWFGEHDAQQVGRITTSGNITVQRLPNVATPTQIVSGPGRQLWLLDTENSEAPTNKSSELAIVSP